jgi:hypothetical protein
MELVCINLLPECRWYLPETFNPAYACTDYPIFRYADALLMRAEASFRLGDKEAAKNDINLIRERAYGSTEGNIQHRKLPLILSSMNEAGSSISKVIVVQT